MLTDPIVALATPPGRSAMAVVRASGRGVFEAAARVVKGFRVEPARQARLAALVDAHGLFDRAIYLTYLGPRSETGEDVVEIICHGGLSVPTRLVAALEKAGCRPAHPGEFTRRAVMHGKMDLLQAEGVADLVDAATPAQGRAAVLQLEGGLSQRIGKLRDGMVELLALLAYEVDFPGEDDGPIPRATLETTRATVLADVERLLATAPAAARLRAGALVVLAGPPNAGKSSLFNALLGTERALVTELPGTTRDAIEAHADFLGFPVRLVDTAGLGEAVDRVDAMGQAVTRRFADGADLVLACAEAASRGVGTPPPLPGVAATTTGAPVPCLRVWTKADQVAGQHAGPGSPQASDVAATDAPPPEELTTSVVTGEGLDALKRAVVAQLFSRGAGFADLEPGLTRERHRTALEQARVELAGAAPHLAAGGDPVLAAHHVQAAVRALDALIGVVDVEEVLGRVFASFCVGK